MKLRNRNVVLNQQTKDQMANSFDLVTSPYGKDVSKAIKEALFLASSLPKEILTACIDLYLSPDVDLVKIDNLPIGANLPASGNYRSKPDFQSEAILLSIASILGMPFSYAQESDGRIIQQVTPRRKMAIEQTSASSKVELLGHTENCFDNMVGYVALLGLRVNPHNPCGTYICHVDDLLKELDKSIIDTLRKPMFRMREIDTSFGGGSGPVCSILFGAPDNLAIRFDHDLMQAMTPEAKVALDQLTTIYLKKRYLIFVEEGTLVLLDNTKIIHGRAPFTVTTFDGQTRWLQRCIVSPVIIKNSPYLHTGTPVIRRENWTGILM